MQDAPSVIPAKAGIQRFGSCYAGSGHGSRRRQPESPDANRIGPGRADPAPSRLLGPGIFPRGPEQPRDEDEGDGRSGERRGEEQPVGETGR